MLVTRWISALVSAATLVGCWTLTSNLGDLESSDTGEDGTSTSGSSGNPKKDAGLLDALASSTSSTSSSGTTTSSSGATVVDAGDGAAGSFCASAGTHTLCDELGGNLGDRWILQQSAGGTATQVSSPVRSAPSAARFTLPSPCTEASGQLGKFFSGQVKTSVISFDAFVVSTPSAASAHLIGWEWDTDAAGTKHFRLDLALRLGKLELYNNDINGAGFEVLQIAADPFTKNTWQRIEVQLDTEAKQARVFVEGTKIIDAALTRFKAQATADTKLDLGFYTGTNCDVASEAIYDNVLVDFVPK